MNRANSDSTKNSKLNTKNYIEVSAALIFRGGKLLITRRHAHSHLGGLWEFPGGKREAHETYEQCLVREIREELGVEISVGALFEEISPRLSRKIRSSEILCLPAAFRRTAAAGLRGGEVG